MDAFATLTAFLVLAVAIATATTNAYAIQRHALKLERRNHVNIRILTIFGCLYIIAVYTFYLAGWFGEAVPPIVARPAFLALIGLLFVRSLE